MWPAVYKVHQSAYNHIILDNNEQETTFQNCCPGDGSVNISDLTTLNDLLLGSGTISNLAADCDQDGIINISDATTLIDSLLTGFWN